MTAYTRTEGLIAAEITATLHLLTGRWISLADVRPHLSRWRRADQDNTLRKMERLQAVRLATQSSRTPLTPEGRAAALDVGGQPKHLIWVCE
jgi:hypothetical protein